MTLPTRDEPAFVGRMRSNEAVSQPPPPGQMSLILAGLTIGLLLLGIQLWLLTIALDLYLAGAGVGTIARGWDVLTSVVNGANARPFPRYDSTEDTPRHQALWAGSNPTVSERPAKTAPSEADHSEPCRCRAVSTRLVGRRGSPSSRCTTCATQAARWLRGRAPPPRS